MFNLKPISAEAVDAALEKARHYRLLNEPMQAESICLDVLEVHSDHQDALVTLILALSDQLERRISPFFEDARAALPRLTNRYQQSYYHGLLCERRAKSHFRSGQPGSGYVAYEWFRKAMTLYEEAETLRPPDNDDAILRWNTCARIINRFPEIQPDPVKSEPYLE